MLHGAMVTTEDMDIVHERSPENVERLAEALKELGAYGRGRPEVIPDRSHLVGPGALLLDTKAGPLDVLGSIGNQRQYPDLVSTTEVLSVDGWRCGCLAWICSSRRRRRLVAPRTWRSCRCYEVFGSGSSRRRSFPSAQSSAVPITSKYVALIDLILLDSITLLAGHGEIVPVCTMLDTSWGEP